MSDGAPRERYGSAFDGHPRQPAQLLAPVQLRRPPGPTPRTSEEKEIPAIKKAEGFESLTYRAIWLYAAAKRRDAAWPLAVVYMSGAQLLGLCLLSVLEIVVGLHEKKPSALPIADRTCLL